MAETLIKYAKGLEPVIYYGQLWRIHAWGPGPDELQIVRRMTQKLNGFCTISYDNENLVLMPSDPELAGATPEFKEAITTVTNDPDKPAEKNLSDSLNLVNSGTASLYSGPLNQSLLLAE
jgi:hypothetical protein